MSQYLDPSRRERAPIDNWPDGVGIIAARATSEAEPAYIIPVQSVDTVRTYCAYDGVISSCALRLWFYVGATWYRGPSTDDGDALTGENEARDWDVSGGTLVGFTVDSIAGGGTVAVIAEGIA